MELSRKPTAGSTRSDDPYLPTHGNGGYRVEHYDLEIDYRVAANRLTGRAVITAVAAGPLSRFTLDLSTFRVPRVRVDGRPAKFTRAGGKLHVTPSRPVAGRFTVEVLAVPWLVGPANGTPVLTAWLRTMGARIGRGVWLETYWLPESDLVRLGDGATVNRGCVVQTHLFHDRIMSMDEVRIDEGATLGPNGIILPGASIGAGTTIGPGSLVTRGDSVPAATRWLGNPITTWS